MDTNTIILEGFVTIQKQNFGVYSDEQIKSASESLTASASHLAKMLKKRAGLTEDQIPENADDGGNKDKDKPKSTQTYHFSIGAKDAVELLNTIDRVEDTEDFTKKFQRYLGVKKMYPGSISQLPLNMKKEAMSALTAVGFTGYSYQVSIRFSESGKFKDDYTQSKKHSYLIPLNIDYLKKHQFKDIDSLVWKGDKVEPVQEPIQIVVPEDNTTSV